MTRKRRAKARDSKARIMACMVTNKCEERIYPNCDGYMAFRGITLPNKVICDNCAWALTQYPENFHRLKPETRAEREALWMKRGWTR